MFIKNEQDVQKRTLRLAYYTLINKDLQLWHEFWIKVRNQMFPIKSHKNCNFPEKDSV
ncbi:hypothetical protein BACEGG_03441 [Bacteroides eggerthii DSM 20697]|nr:hypothetical protein BACEGG_03441 [Bacteroides eggerthii DSM 20697]